MVVEIVVAWLLFNVAFFSWLSRRSRSRMKTNVCGRVHQGPVVVWQGNKAVCEHCNNVLNAKEIVAFNKTRSQARSIMAEAANYAKSR